MSSKRFRWITTLLWLGLVVAGCSKPREDASKTAADRIAPPPIDAGLQSTLEKWFAEHGQPPVEYVVGLFGRHDVVVLGEQHRIRDDEILVQQLLPRLQAAGVRVLATEFARREDQALLDSLVNAPEWDEAVGRDILFRQFVAWGYREYLDILKAAWQVNHDRPAGTPPLRVLGVNNSPDYSFIRSEADWNDREIWKRVQHGQTEADWATPVLAAVRRGEKVLVHCGIHHGFTGYRQPVVKDGAFVEFAQGRFGNCLRDSLGMRAVTVYLHAPWNGLEGYAASFVHPAGGRIDAFMLARSGGPFPLGFDVAGSPLADLPITGTVYEHGYAPFTMAKFCDGWIYTRPVSEFEPVGYIEGWINPQNLARARANSMQPRWRDGSVELLNDGCKSYLDDFRHFFGHLR